MTLTLILENGPAVRNGIRTDFLVDTDALANTAKAWNGLSFDGEFFTVLPGDPYRWRRESTGEIYKEKL